VWRRLAGEAYLAVMVGSAVVFALFWIFTHS
jgi:hypothetical protein